MSLGRLATASGFSPLVARQGLKYGQPAWQYSLQSRHNSSSPQSKEAQSPPESKPGSPTPTRSDDANASMPDGWEDQPDLSITRFSELPHRFFGTNQHIRINEDFKEALRQILWQFKAPIPYAFAYGSGVFAQKGKPMQPGALSPHPHPPEAVVKWQEGGAKIIDFIFGVSFTQHWHDINKRQYPEHYSGLRHFGSGTLAKVQDSWGAGVYFNPYITVNGTMIKYGVVNLDTICQDLTEWNTLYLAGRLQKPVKILRDSPRVRLANQINLVSAVRAALLMLPEKFSERELYETITSLSYIGDPRMSFGTESTSKVRNIVANQLPNFRQLYVPLVDNLPNVRFIDRGVPKESGWEREDVMARSVATRNPAEVIGGNDGFMMEQDMSAQRRGNMVRRLPRLFRQKIYYQYRKKFGIPGTAFSEIIDESNTEGAYSFSKREAGEFDKRIALEEDLNKVVERCIGNTIGWPSTSQSIKGIFTAGLGRSWKYWGDKRQRYKESEVKSEPAKAEEKPSKEKSG